MAEQWRPLCSVEELDIDTTLMCGQTFRWVRLAVDNGANPLWRGVVGRSVVSLRAEGGSVSWKLDASHGVSNVNDARVLDATEVAVRDYFRLSDAFSLPALYRSWSAVTLDGTADPSSDGAVDESPAIKSERDASLVGSKRARASDEDADLDAATAAADTPAPKRSKSTKSRSSRVSSTSTQATTTSPTTKKAAASTSKLSGQVRVRQRFGEVAGAVRGLRLLRQPPVECTFSFICSQNNNVARIQQLVRSLAEQAGTEIATIEGQRYFIFPTVEALSKLTEKDLRSHAFGYRAKYIPAAASKILERSRQLQHNSDSSESSQPATGTGEDGDPGSGWLYSLRTTPYNETHQELQSLDGVGPKVADCIALFSLDKLDAIPVDTHVRQIASRYMSGLDQKSVSRAVYERVGEFFRGAFPLHAGWAHSILFAAELRSFQAKIKAENAAAPQASGSE